MLPKKRGENNGVNKTDVKLWIDIGEIWELNKPSKEQKIFDVGPGGSEIKEVGPDEVDGELFRR